MRCVLSEVAAAAVAETEKKSFYRRCCCRRPRWRRYVCDHDNQQLSSFAIIRLVAFLSAMSQTTVSALQLKQCSATLGMQTGDISDSSLSASSSSDPLLFGPQNARVRVEINGGAWCPSQKVGPGIYEYLQIELTELKVISHVETQGRFGNGQGQEFTEQYHIEYRRQDNGPWFQFRNRKGDQIFQGNTNTHISEMLELDPPLIAKTVRFVPYSPRLRTVCLRVELYGCTWTDGLVSYSMPQGERRNNEIGLLDFTYDGNITQDNQLYGGLGQLTDGDEGQSNFRSDPSSRGVRGYEWVGWKNESFTVDRPLEIICRFDAVRNFSLLQIHANNQYHREVRVFSRATVSVVDGDDNWNIFASRSPDGTASKQQHLTYSYKRDSVSETAKTVRIPLINLIGRTLRVRLDFDAKWMMISEIQFESTIVDIPPTAAPPALDVPVAAEYDRTNIWRRVTDEGVNDVTQRQKPSFQSEEENGDDRSRGDFRQPIMNSSSWFTDFEALLPVPGPSSLPPSGSDVVSADNEHGVSKPTSTPSSDDDVANGNRRHVIDLIVGVVVTCLLAVIIVVILAIWTWRRRKHNCKDLWSKQRSHYNSHNRHQYQESTGNQSQHDIKTTMFQPNGSSGSAVAGFSMTLTSTPTTVRTFSPPQHAFIDDRPRLPPRPTLHRVNNVTISSESRLPPPPLPPGGTHRRQRQQLVVTSSSAGTSGLPSTAATSIDDGTYYCVSDGGLTEHLLPVHTRRREQPPSSSLSATLRSMAVMTAAKRRAAGGGVGGCLDLSQSSASTGLGLEDDAFLRAPAVATESAGGVATTISRVRGLGYRSTVGGQTSPTNLPQSQPPIDLGVVELPRQRLNYVEKLGTGTFGEIFLASLQRTYSTTSYDTTVDRMPTTPEHCLVAVATLAGVSNHSAVAEFNRQMTQTGRINDVNIVRLIGVCTREEPYCLVLEYTDCGNLVNYLRTQNLTNSCLVNMAAQIAAGMKHLEVLNIVHGDLAARNCLVDSSSNLDRRLTVKIANFGIGRAMFPQDYWFIPSGSATDGQHSSVPLRWMACEAVVHAMYTVRSDVWSFGVTMWEVLTRASTRPYDWLTDQQVLDNCQRRYQADHDAADDDATSLPVPSDDCPKELYDLMLQCWATVPQHRPTFHEIQMFLVRKNDGYRPPQPAPTSPSLPSIAQHATASTMICRSPPITDFII